MSKTNSDELKNAVRDYLITGLKNGVNGDDEAVEPLSASLVTAAISYLKLYPASPEDPMNFQSSGEMSNLLKGANSSVTRRFEAKTQPN